MHQQQQQQPAPRPCVGASDGCAYREEAGDGQLRVLGRRTEQLDRPAEHDNGASAATDNAHGPSSSPSSPSFFPSQFDEEQRELLVSLYDTLTHEVEAGADLRALVLQEFGIELKHYHDDKGQARRPVPTVYEAACLLTTLLHRSRARTKLADVNTIDDVVSRIRSATRIMVLCGAGVSTSCGIPDFRSEGGIYQRVQARYEFLTDPQLLFDVRLFRIDARPFFEFAAEILPSDTVRPSPSHRFIAELERRGKLQRCYTQNIDGLEAAAGVQRVVCCHGSFDTATCMRCRRSRKVEGALKEAIRCGQVPYCDACTEDGDGDDDDGTAAEPLMKPDIVFFGEALPQAVHDHLERDIRDVDLLLVLGTSLRVAPVAKIPSALPRAVPQVLLNRMAVGAPNEFDVELLGDCDTVVRALMLRLGWVERGCAEERDAYEFVEPNRYLFDGACAAEERLSFSDASSFSCSSSSSLSEDEEHEGAGECDDKGDEDAGGVTTSAAAKA